MTTWFTSDTHFNHIKILEYCAQQRPFKDLNEMNATLIKNFNERVQPGDTVYHLGDYAMGKKTEWQQFRKQLNGKIILVSGNHDGKPEFMKDVIGFDEVHPFDKPIVIELEGVKLVLNHMPLPKHQWPHGTDYQLCGHVHQEFARQGNIINVGVDVRDLRPATLDELLK